MNLLKVQFVFLFLVFGVVIAGNSNDDYDDYSSEKEDCDGKRCPSKSQKQNDEDYDGDSDDYDDESGNLDNDFGESESDSDSFEDASSTGRCDGNRDKCPSKPRMTNLQGSCNRCGIAYGGAGSGRVINGKAVKPVYKYPWIVSLIKDNEISCGGTLISANFVMTAAHCVFNLQKVRIPQCKGRRVHRMCLFPPNAIKVGLFGPKQRTPSETMVIRKIIHHPMYSFTMQIHDFALIQLARPVRCSGYTLPVCLPNRDFSKLGTPLITAGYGHNTPEGQAGPQVLREGSVKEIEPRNCAKRSQPADILKNIVCAAGLESGQSSCYGDSGSSLFGKFGNKFYAVGVVSFGRSPVCSAQNPVTYTKVFTALPFIRKQVKNLPRG